MRKISLGLIAVAILMLVGGMLYAQLHTTPAPSGTYQIDVQGGYVRATGIMSFKVIFENQLSGEIPAGRLHVDVTRGTTGWYGDTDPISVGQFNGTNPVTVTILKPSAGWKPVGSSGLVQVVFTVRFLDDLNNEIPIMTKAISVDTT